MRQSTSDATLHHKQPAETGGRDRPRLRLDVLDGIRGLAAIYVALFHAMGYTGTMTTLQTQASAATQFIAALLAYGAYAVPIFIVLSGFCLMLPLAQRETTALPGGIMAYLRRRAWRILPSYYVALLLSLALIALIPALQTPGNTAWDTKIPVTTGSIISHLLLVQNLRPDWIYKIDGPMWSIAIEWQIYFLFPALLLILRRTNLLIMVGLAMLLGVLPHFVLRAWIDTDFTHPWFLGLFALGMAGAKIAFSNDPAVVGYREKVPWAWLNPAATVALVAALALRKDWMEWHLYIAEPLVGLIVMCWLIQYTNAVRQGRRRSWSQRVLESRPVVGLGIFSYSIYLIHSPIQALINLETLNIAMPAGVRLALMVGVATPFAVLCAYVFYVLVEHKSIQLRERIAPAPRPTSAPVRTTP